MKLTARIKTPSKLTANIKEPTKIVANFKELRLPLDGGYDEGYESGYDNGYTTAVNSYEPEIATQKELLEQAITELEGKVDPELYNKGYQDGVEAGQALEDALIDRTISGDYVNDRITILGSSIFRDCGKITGISCANVTEVDSRAIYGCGKLKTVYLPNVETFSDYAVYMCSALTSIYVPKLKTTASQAMARSTGLTEIELPSIEVISSSCFDRCSKLVKVILSGNTIATLQGTAFTNTPIASGKGYVYVPDDLVEDYKAATNWSNYASQIKPLSELEV